MGVHMAKSFNIGFIGTGIMGAPIAGHILDAGYNVNVYNRTKKKAEDLINRGAHWVDSVEEIAKTSDVIFTMLGFPQDVEEVYLSKSGLLQCSKKGTYLIDLTTTAPELARDIYNAAQAAGCHAFDCPVTGGESGAQAGTLTLIVGSSEQEIAPVRPILETFGKKILCFDKAGQGQTEQLANQIALAGSMCGMAEALSFAAVNGLNQYDVRNLILSGTGKSGAMESLGLKAIDGDYKPGFLVEHFLKDIGLALQAAEEEELRLPAMETAFSLYDMLDCIGGSRLGTQSLPVLYQEEADAVAAGLDWSLYTSSLEDEHDEYQHQDECGCNCDNDADACHSHGNQSNDADTCNCDCGCDE